MRKIAAASAVAMMVAAGASAAGAAETDRKWYGDFWFAGATVGTYVMPNVRAEVSAGLAAFVFPALGAAAFYDFVDFGFDAGPLHGVPYAGGGVDYLNIGTYSGYDVGSIISTFGEVGVSFDVSEWASQYVWDLPVFVAPRLRYSVTTWDTDLYGDAAYGGFEPNIDIRLWF